MTVWLHQGSTRWTPPQEESNNPAIPLNKQGRNSYFICRIPFSASSTTHAPWSAPCFITMNAVQVGAVVGLQRCINIVGILEEAALRRVMAGRGYHTTAEWGASIALKWEGRGGICQDNSQRAYLSPDAGGKCIHEWGAMVNVGLSGVSIAIDKKRNEFTYGRETTAAQILLGDVAPPNDVFKLFDKIAHVSNAANMAAFLDPSTASTNQITTSRSKQH